MTDLRKAAEMALKALEKYEDEWLDDGRRIYVDAELDALRQALAQPEQGCAECGVKTSDGYALYCVKCTELFAQPEQEPVAWITNNYEQDRSATTYSADMANRWRDKGWPVAPLYTAPVSKPWVSLGREDILREVKKIPALETAEDEWLFFAEAYEAKLKELNT